jgi:cobyrinic acid a,c-diamide synthase
VVNVPRVVIAAPASGHGKTTVATGLLAAFTARGLVASGHKIGPDYIDPSYHSLACGRPGRNLDPFLIGPDLVAPLFAHGARGADVAVIEGVMGLFDGVTGAADFGSTAHVAELLQAPVVLVVDATAQGRSIAALVHGFRSWQPAVRLGGVILNRVGSERHEVILREALEDLGTPVLGVLHRHDSVEAPSRHLGLVPAAERSAEALSTVDAVRGVVARGVDLDAVLAVARTATDLDTRPWSAEVAEPVAGRPLIALAGGPAFTFAYAEHAELLAAAGAEIGVVDPLRDTALPAGTAALVVGGGFPEVYAEQLSANEPLRAAVRELAMSGAPVAAECAGLLWLSRSLDGAPMCGVLDADAAMSSSLTLGYREAVAVSGSVLAQAGQRVNGHEFHRTTIRPRAGSAAAWAWRGAEAEGFVQGGVHASYLHTHWVGTPSIAHRLVSAAATFRNDHGDRPASRRQHAGLAP